jgi:hypothetical protein
MAVSLTTVANMYIECMNDKTGFIDYVTHSVEIICCSVGSHLKGLARSSLF